MVSKVDTSAVCGHLNATLSGIVPNSGITKGVGLLVNATPSNYVELAKQIGLVFHNAVQGNFLVDPREIPCLSVCQDDSYEDWDGNPIPGNHYAEEWINTLLHLPRSPDTIKLWAGMTNLKSAAVIERLSRTELADQRAAIAHVTAIDPSVLQGWREFVDKFVPRIVDDLSISDERTYDILINTSRSGKASRYCANNGELKPCERGSREFSDLRSALRHPVINRIFRRFPVDSIAATIVGTDRIEVGGFTNSMPTPHDHELPVGAAVVVPKDAQKPRTVWILVGVLDSMTRPMFHKLEEIEARWNIQGVMDQDGARRLVSRILRSNKTRKIPKVICSYDQSAFTDNFSYDFVQRPVVEALVRTHVLREYDLALLDEINHGEWDAKGIGLKHQTISFGTGTGMGTPPSFPLASITNGLMVAYAYYQAYGKVPSPTGRNVPGLVVGDDCVIFDERVGMHYEQFCSDIGLKINFDKSFKNTHVAEFCGKYITADGIYSKRKLIYPSGLDAVPDFIDYYNDKVEEYFRVYPNLDQAEVARILTMVREIPSPYGRGKPVDTLDLDSASSIELQTFLMHSASKARDYMRPGPMSRRNVEEYVRRHGRIPWIVDGITLIEKPFHEEPAEENILAASLARDITGLSKAGLSSTDREQLNLSAVEIKRKLDFLTTLNPQKVVSSGPPRLMPKQSAEERANILLIRNGLSLDQVDPKDGLGLDST